MDQTLWGTLSAVARVRADHPAVIFGERTLSYAQLLNRASRASAVLSSLGVRAGDRVAFLAAHVPRREQVNEEADTGDDAEHRR